MTVTAEMVSLWSHIKTRRILVDLLAVFFGISSWISINGLWVELPLLVQRLNEGWALASYLSIIVQIANLGPITYAILRWLTSDKIPAAAVIVFLLSLGSVSSGLLAAFWDQTTNVWGTEHSTALFVLVFFLSLVDCTSSVLFLPFMAVFRDIYLNSYLIGEGLSGFIPAIAALAQGVGGNPYCVNSTTNNNNSDVVDYEMEKVTPEPRFSVEAFFMFLTGMMVVSLSSFLLLKCLPVVEKEHAINHQFVVDDRRQSIMSTYSDIDAPWVNRREIRHRGMSEAEEHSSMIEFVLLLLVQVYVCFLSNGAFPSIQTYSCLPYGNTVYHLSVTLHAMANPVMAFFAFFVPCKKVSHIIALTAIGSIFAAFLMATALTSPDMLWGQNVGGAMTVVSWIVYGGLFAYVKVSVAGVCRQKSKSALFWCGAVTQIGSAFGALLMFLLVNVATGVFNAYYVQC